ncbi:MAG: capsular biosynthesis protein CpsG [Lachnospiraceae bacterium]|nr:capsular biosynthesis protein CpsG [Lachnospiraceae bacterium]
MNILVTTGTGAEYQFERLLNIIDELCEEKVINSQQLVVQSTDRYKAKNYEIKDMMPQNEFDEIMKKADLIITHAGTGTVTKALKYSKKVIMFPRRAMYNEHMDDHQLDLCELFCNLNYAILATDKNELTEAIKTIDNFVPERFVSQNIKINQIVKDFIEK